MGKRKYIIAVAVAIIVVVAGIYCYVEHREKEIIINFDEKGEIIFPERSSRDDDMEWAKTIVNYQEKAAEMFKNDAVGGKTPQETLDLFVEALKVGDTDLASRYFVVSKQEQMAKELLRIQTDGYLGDMVEDLLTVQESGYLSDGSFRYVILGDDNVVALIFDLILNENKGVWKIKSL